jgi:hypothetical protein
MVEISSSGSGGGPGWETAPGYPIPRAAPSFSKGVPKDPRSHGSFNPFGVSWQPGTIPASGPHMFCLVFNPLAKVDGKLLADASPVLRFAP